MKMAFSSFRESVLEALMGTPYINQGGLTRDEIINYVKKKTGSSDEDYDGIVKRELTGLVKDGLVAVDKRSGIKRYSTFHSMRTRPWPDELLLQHGSRRPEEDEEEK